MNVSTPLPNRDLPLDGFRVYCDFGYEDAQYDAMSRSSFPAPKIIDVRGSAITRNPHRSKARVDTAANFLALPLKEPEYQDRYGHGETYADFDGLIVADNEAWIPVDENDVADAEPSGTHDAATSSTVLTDSGESWTADAYIGAMIKNTTTGASGVITDNTTNTITVASLSGGSRQDWQNGDTFEVNGFITLAQTKVALENSVALLREVYPQAKIGCWGIPSSSVQEDGGAVVYTAAQWGSDWWLDNWDFAAAHLYTDLTDFSSGFGATMISRATEALATGLPWLAYLEPRTATGNGVIYSIQDVVSQAQYAKSRGAFGVAIWSSLTRFNGHNVTGLPTDYIYTGTHTGSTSTTQLIDSAAQFRDESLKQARIHNVTTGDSVLVSSHDASDGDTELNVASWNGGGSRQDFQSGDEYEVWDFFRYWQDLLTALNSLATK